MRRLDVTCALAAAAVASGCSRSTTSAEEPAALIATLDVAATTTVRDTVILTLRVVNVTDAAVSLELPSNSNDAFNPIVFDSDGRFVWSALGPIAPAGPVLLTHLSPGAERTFRQTWTLKTTDQRTVAPGRYVVRGRFFSGGDSVITPSREITVRLTQ